MNTLYPALDAPVDAPWLMRALGYLGLPPELGQRVQGWTGDPRQMRAVIEFLHRAQWERKAWEDRLAAGRAVYGQAADRNYDTGRKEEAGRTGFPERRRRGRAPRHPTGFVPARRIHWRHL